MKNASEKYGYDSCFPTRFRELMGLNKVSQTVMAELCGVQRQSISLWYNGDTRPDIISLGKIAQYFGVSTDYLLGLTDYKTTDRATKELCNTLGLSEDAVDILSENPNSRLANQYRDMIRKSFIDFEEEFDEELVEGETSVMIEAFSYKVSETINWLVNDYIEGVNTALNNDGDYWTERSLIDLLHHFVESLDASENFSIEDMTKGIEKTDNCYSLLNASFSMRSKDGKKFWVPITMKELLINSAIGEINTRLHNIKHEKLGE